MSSLPLVSVVTPSYNQGRFIRETIESVLGQDYPRIEYLVMDGGSTDQTVAVLHDYAGRLTWISAPDRGQAHAVNMGWRRASGEILAYLNSDDLYHPRAVSRAVAALLANPEAPGVYGEGDHIDEAGQRIDRYPTESFDLDRLAETCFICQPTVFLRAHIVRHVGYLDEDLRYAMDYDLWIRVGRLGPLVHVPEPLASTRLHAETKTLGQRARAHAEILNVVRRHYGHVPPSWVYAYAQAVLGSPRRDGLAQDAWFKMRLTAITMANFLRWNRGIPLGEVRRWFSWVRRGWDGRRTRRTLP